MAKTPTKAEQYQARLNELIELRKSNQITQDDYDARHRALVEEIYADKTN